MFFILAALGIIISLVGIGFCLYALSQIKNHSDEYEGKAMVLAALLLILISPLILLIVSLL
jgi:hypothetical protein